LSIGTNHSASRSRAILVPRVSFAAMGWALPYTLGVLGRWKMAAVYCQAVLSHDPYCP
jgi:hypothetical protein